MGMGRQAVSLGVWMRWCVDDAQAGPASRPSFSEVLSPWWPLNPTRNTSQMGTCVFMMSRRSSRSIGIPCGAR